MDSSSISPDSQPKQAKPEETKFPVKRRATDDDSDSSSQAPQSEDSDNTDNDILRKYSPGLRAKITSTSLKLQGEHADKVENLEPTKKRASDQLPVAMRKKSS